MIADPWRDVLAKEIQKGGSEAPCPFCHIPRVRRSEYIRCCSCGINWIDGEPLDKDPRNERYRKLLEDARSYANKTKKEDEYARR